MGEAVRDGGHRQDFVTKATKQIVVLMLGKVGPIHRSPEEIIFDVWGFVKDADCRKQKPTRREPRMNALK